MNKLILTLLIGFLVPVLLPALDLPKPVAPKPGEGCGGCICIPAGSTVTIPAGRCGMTVPGGDVIHASGGDVTVTTGANGKVTGIVLAPGAWADVTIFNGPTTINVTGGPGTATFEGYGNTINNNSPGTNISSLGNGNTINNAAGGGNVTVIGNGNTINNSAGGNVTVAGTSNTLHHQSPIGTHPNYDSSSYSNHLYAHGNTSFGTTGDITVHP